MKTSNKILIAFAAALILIPILGMVFVSTTMYKKGNYSDVVDVVKRTENFSNASANMTSIALATNFTAVNIEDAKNRSLSIELIKDTQFGIKFSNDLKNLISTQVDNQGKLQIVFKANSNDENQRRKHNVIYIYAPNVPELTVTNANVLGLKSLSDTLNLKLNQIGNFYFENEIKIKKLNLSAKNIKDLALRRDSIQSVDISLTDTKFSIESMSLESANINATGNCSIAIYSTENNQKFSIKNLVLHTKGIAAVKIEDVNVGQCSGSFSDQTQVQMPAINLNQMYNKK